MMVHRKMLALTEGSRARIALTVALGLAISGTFVAQGVVVALVVSRVLAGEPWTGALALVGVVAQGLPGRVRLHGHLRASGRKAGGG